MIRPSLDELVIIAGACQSHFSSLLTSGANFASSPAQVNIHTLDPAYLAGQISHSPVTDFVKLQKIIGETTAGTKGFGGVDTKGTLRTGIGIV